MKALDPPLAPSRMTIHDLKARWSAFARTRRGQRTLKALNGLLMLGVLGYLAVELTAIGWDAIWRSLPTTPWFYVLFALLYVSLPVAEVFIYRVTWAFDGWRSFPAFIKKRVYNRDVMGYSGEVYFFAWARRHLGLPDAEILKTIRDNNILSSVASTAVAVALLGVFVMAGHVSLTDWIGDRAGTYALVGAAGLAVLAPILLRYRRYLFSMAWKPALLILGIQAGRLVLGQVMQIAQWEVVIPEVEMGVWFTFAAVSIILTRIPFLPNQNLIFLGAGVELSGMMDVPTAALAGMLLVTSVLDKAVNVTLFALISLGERRRRAAAAAEADAEADAALPSDPRPAAAVAERDGASVPA